VAAGQRLLWDATEPRLVALGSAEPATGPSVSMTWNATRGNLAWASSAVSLLPASSAEDAGTVDSGTDVGALEAPLAVDDGDAAVDAEPRDGGLDVTEGEASAAIVNLRVGCACRMGAARSPAGSAVGPLLAALALLRRRQRRR
jgi:MYXO-CTERM domain-containing protein